MFLLSLPMRGRGLKYYLADGVINPVRVAPHAGAWIEILPHHGRATPPHRRSPCGGVD